MNLIDATYFIGEINVPNIDSESVSENLNYFISKYEKRFLSMLLGENVRGLFLAGLSEENPDQKWIDLKAKLVDDSTKISPIANYVYRFFQYSENTLTSGVGEIKAKAENSVNASIVPKVVRAWNEMIDWMIYTYGWFEEFYRENELTGYYFNSCHGHNEFVKINRFGL